MIQLPQLQEALLVASDGMVARSRRRAQRFRLGLMTTAAVATIGGGAVASQGLWGPVVGLDAERTPSVSSAPAPASQRALLSVLRRPQAAADRSAASQYALRLVTRRYSDVRIADVRRIGSASSAEAVVLIPVGETRARSGVPQRVAGGDALCLFSVDLRAVGAADQKCFSEEDLRDGTAWKITSTQVAGLVPDGVAAVRLVAPGRGTFDVPVTANAFTVPTSRLSPGTTVAWRRADGSPAPFSGGGPTRALQIPIALKDGRVPNSREHDCGIRAGGIVPRTVRCGAPARAYAARKAKQDAENRRAVEAGGAAVAAPGN